MPTYLYKCGNCGETLEILQKITDKPKTECPSCKKDSLKKKPTCGSGVHFKGSGFYETDYKGK